MEKIEAEICYHPELIPTAWEQKKPEPCKMILTCECGANQTCPVCGWGHGAYPCACMMKYMKEHPTQFYPDGNDEITHEVFLEKILKKQ